MDYKLTDGTDSIIKHFGLEKQKEKMIEEILELEISIRNLCLFYQNKKTKTYQMEDDNSKEMEITLQSNVIEEFADVVCMAMQINKYGFNKMFEMVYHKNAYHLSMLKKQIGFEVKKPDVHEWVESKVERTIDRYDIEVIRREVNVGK